MKSLTPLYSLHSAAYHHILLTIFFSTHALYPNEYLKGHLILADHPVRKRVLFHSETNNNEASSRLLLQYPVLYSTRTQYTDEYCVRVEYRTGYCIRPEHNIRMNIPCFSLQ